MSIGELFLRIVLSFTVLLILMRIVGRKELSEMTFFNFVSGIAIGSIAAGFVYSKEFIIWHALIALASWSLLTLITDFIDIKSISGRRVLSGEPVIVIKNGKLSKDAMRKCRLDVDKLAAKLREKKVFSFADVDFAIFETSGKMSVLKKEEKLAASKGDINKPIGQKVYPIPTLVISDGKFLKNNIEKLGLTVDWIEAELKKADVGSEKEIFLAEVETDGTLYIDQYK